MSESAGLKVSVAGPGTGIRHAAAPLRLHAVEAEQASSASTRGVIAFHAPLRESRLQRGVAADRFKAPRPPLVLVDESDHVRAAESFAENPTYPERAMFSRLVIAETYSLFGNIAELAREQFHASVDRSWDGHFVR